MRLDELNDVTQEIQKGVRECIEGRRAWSLLTSCLATYRSDQHLQYFKSDSDVRCSVWTGRNLIR